MLALFASLILYTPEAALGPNRKFQYLLLTETISEKLRIASPIIISIGITGDERLEVIPAGEFFPKRTYGVVLRKGRILTPQAKKFVDLLLSAGEIPTVPTRNGNNFKSALAAAPKM